MKNGADALRNDPSFEDCLMTIMPFLVWAADENKAYGGVEAVDALESFRYILGWDKERFDLLCKVFTGDID
jgi:hypothetical protein